MAPFIALVAVAFLCLLVFGAKVTVWIVGIIVGISALLFILLWGGSPKAFAEAMRKADAEIDRANREKKKPDDDWRNRPR